MQSTAVASRWPALFAGRRIYAVLGRMSTAGRVA